MYYTAQRFGHVDALLRQVTSCVVDCDKLWRFQRQNLYDAWEMENATNTQLLTPLTRRCWFVTNKDYAAYDTLALWAICKSPSRRAICCLEEEILSAPERAAGQYGRCGQALPEVAEKSEEIT